MALQMRDAHGLRRIQKTLTIQRPPEMLYRAWRDFTRFPEFMDHVKSVTLEDDVLSHWTVKAPVGQEVEWDAEIREDRENERIVWHSLPDAQVENGGEVNFRLAPDGRGTEMSVLLVYAPPGGSVGAALAKMFGEEPSQQLDEDLYRFKQLMETGLIPTSEGQPHGED